jgi:alkylated DNA repair protein (DNA oxidative demethylase)
MSVRIANAGALGWVADANGYRYAPTSPKTGKPWPPIPDEWRDLADRFAGAHPWDCAHLVYYGPSATLGWHRDKTEKSKRWPIVTFSLGDEASWAVREDDGEPIHRTRLPSGAVTLLAGEARNYLHTIERIEPAMALLSPSPLKGPGRLAISLRVAG